VKGMTCIKIIDQVTQSSSDDLRGHVSARSSFPQTVATAQREYQVTVEESVMSGAAIKPAIMFSSSVDISKSRLSVQVDMAGGVTGGVAVQIFSGPYTGKFSEVTISVYSSTGPMCDRDSVNFSVDYTQNGITFKSTCGCDLSGARRRRVSSEQRSMDMSPLLNLMKRQPVSFQESPSSSSSSPTFASAGIIGFRQDLEKCQNQWAEKLLPRLISVFADVSFSASKSGVCSFDTTTRDANGRLPAEVWAKDQVKIDGSTFSLKYLTSWDGDKKGGAIQPIDDGKTLQDTFKDADWLEKTGRFCISCAEGVNKDVGKAPGDTIAASTLSIAFFATIVAIAAAAL